MRDASSGLRALGELLRQAQATPTVSYPCSRPTVTDQRFRGDACVVHADDGVFHLCLGNFAAARLPGVFFDLPSLNILVERLRQAPRPR